jgi:hypothetical protein
MEKKVCGATWLCDPDRAVRECNTETNDGIRSVEQLGAKNLSPVVKRMKSMNKVWFSERRPRRKKPLAVAKILEFSKMM